MKKIVLLLIIFSMFLLVACVQEKAQEPIPVDEISSEVLGCDYDDPPKKYVGRSPEECAVIDFDCGSPEEKMVIFSNECGCGCEPIVEEPDVLFDTHNVKSFIIEADDRGFYPNSIEINEGETVVITFKVRGEGTYFGGLDFRSDAFGDTGKVPPGEELQVEFVAEDSVHFESYWPATNQLKATGEIIVK